MDRVILHCDMNNFFASVECKLDPSLRPLCVAVCGDPADRHGIVLAKNQKAKIKGVQTGQTIWQAKLCCPELVVVHPHYDQYSYYSRKAREIYYRYTDRVEPFGMDECWLDVTGSVSLFGSGEQIAQMIRQSIKAELGLTISVGVSFNKVFAKLGSDMKKPDAVTVIGKQDFRQKIWHLPAEQLLGVGRATQNKLHSLGIWTIGQLAGYPRQYLSLSLGKCGGMLWDFANGLEEGRVMDHGEYSPIKSIGHGTTTKEDLLTESQVWRVLLELSQQIAYKLRKNQLAAKGVQLSVKNNRLETVEYQARFPEGRQSAMSMARLAFQLFKKRYHWKYPVRALTIRAISLEEAGAPMQLDLFGDGAKRIRQDTIDQTVDKLRGRFGEQAVRNAVLLQDLKMSGRFANNT